MKDKLRLCLSLLIAACGSNPLRHDFWRRLGKAVKLWFGGLKEGGKVSDEVYRKRIEACKQCPVSFQKFGLLTCGSPLSRSVITSPGRGPCWCDLYSKSRLKDATCWLDDTTTLNYGWRRTCAKDCATESNIEQRYPQLEA